MPKAREKVVDVTMAENSNLIDASILLQVVNVCELFFINFPM